MPEPDGVTSAVGKTVVIDVNGLVKTMNGITFPLTPLRSSSSFLPVQNIGDEKHVTNVVKKTASGTLVDVPVSMYQKKLYELYAIAEKDLFFPSSQFEGFGIGMFVQRGNYIPKDPFSFQSELCSTSTSTVNTKNNNSCDISKYYTVDKEQDCKDFFQGVLPYPFNVSLIKGDVVFCSIKKIKNGRGIEENRFKGITAQELEEIYGSWNPDYFPSAEERFEKVTNVLKICMVERSTDHFETATMSAKNKKRKISAITSTTSTTSTTANTTKPNKKKKTTVSIKTTSGATKGKKGTPAAASGAKKTISTSDTTVSRKSKNKGDEEYTSDYDDDEYDDESYFDEDESEEEEEEEENGWNTLDDEEIFVNEGVVDEEDQSEEDDDEVEVDDIELID